MPSFHENEVLTYDGDRKCSKCDLVATKKVREGQPPASWNNHEGYISYFYCDTHFAEWKEDQNIFSPETIEEVRNTLLKGGMDEREVNKMIMLTFSPKGKDSTK